MKMTIYILMMFAITTSGKYMEKNAISNTFPIYANAITYKYDNHLLFFEDTITANGWNYKSIESLKENYTHLKIQCNQNNVILYFDNINDTYDRISQYEILEKYDLKTIKGKLILCNNEYDYILKNNKIYVNTSVFQQYVKLIDDFYTNNAVYLSYKGLKQ